MNSSINYKNSKYDLEERTALFAEGIITLCKRIHKDMVTLPLINQLIRSSTSIGANYCEANGASSRKDFKNKIFICKKEAKETMYWIRLLAYASEDSKEDCSIQLQEAKELTLIFSKIASKTDIN